MAKVTLRASGGLNKDVDPNNLQEGDYVDALNLVFDTGAGGGATAMRMYEAFSNTGITIPGTIKATFQNNDGIIYVLTRVDSVTSAIYKISATLGSYSKVLDYLHTGVSDSFVPDIKVIGNTIIWNYAEEGTLLSFFLDRIQNTTYTLDALKLQKRPPINAYTIQKSLTGTAVNFLESNDFQFAARYQYDSKEYSALSNFSQMYKGEKGVSKYTISYNFASKPTFSENIELYVRIGNNGVWRRIDTTSVATNTSFDWAGDIYEALDTVSSTKPFDAVPQNAKHIEIAKNRVFVANIQDDYSIEAKNTAITITSATETALASGDYKTYLGGTTVTATSSELSSNGTGYVKPFANNSTYAVGIAYYDSALKTRGVEPNTIHKFSTGKFTYPLIKNITVTPTSGTYQRPAWAKYIQLCFTKNISKSYVYEGYASNIFFELSATETNPTTLEVTTIKTLSQSITKNQLKDLKYFVVDLMGMFSAGNIYTYQIGDRITINTPAGLLDLKIAQQNNNLVYCEYSGGEMTNPEIPVPLNNYFEIYSPTVQQEDESLLFYESGNLIPIDDTWTGTTFTGSGTLNSNKIIGDMVFSKIEIPVYKNAPFLYNVEKPHPSEDYIVEDRVTEVICAMTTETIEGVLTTSAVSTSKFSPTWTSFGLNQDTASIIGADLISASSGSSFRVSGYYEAGYQDYTVNKINIDYKFDIDNTIVFLTGGTNPITGTVLPPAGGLRLNISTQLWRVPYDGVRNIYEKPVEFGKPSTALSTVLSSTSPATATVVASQVLPLNADINARDRFYIEITVDSSNIGDAITSSFTIKKPATGTAIKLTLNGDRTTPVERTTYNSNATVDSANQKFLIRSISNATANQRWNTSAGKPLLSSPNLSFPRRTNTIRYSGNYVPGTKINNVNSFFGLDANDVPIENGEITSLQRASRLQGNGAMLLALCLREASYVFLGEQELSQGNNAGIRALTANMIGTIRNLGNNYGLADKQSVMNYKGNIWWWDDFNKKVIKYSEQGISVPSDVFMRSYFLGQGGSGNVARFAYDPFYDMCFIGFTSNGTSVGYSDKLNRWISSYSFRTGFAESFGDKMVLFRDNIVYKSGQSGYNTFFGGTAYDTTVSFVSNTKTPVMPQNLSVWHDMNVVNYANANGVKSSLLKIDITNENGQVSELTEGNFIVEDNKLYAHILRDMNTTGSIVRANLIEGNYIVGYLNKFVVTLKDRSQSMRINSIDIEVQPISGHS